MSAVRSLYRAYLRQVRALPHSYLRHFFAIKGADDFRALLRTESPALRARKLKRVSKDLRRLRAAHGGQSTAFDRMLDIAYGRVGRLRYELMEPLLSGANAPLLPSANLRREEFCSPPYSPELVALLTSAISRTTRPLQKSHLVSPPGLRGHTKSDLEDRVLLKPPSRRRERNTRWRFFRTEWKKIYPPLQSSLLHPASNTNAHSASDPPLQFGFQNVTTLNELLALGRSPSRLPELPSRQRGERTEGVFDANLLGSLSARWLRRRYQALLGRVPLLIIRSSPKHNGNRTYDIQLADNAMTARKSHSSRLRLVDPEDVLWISDVNQLGKHCN